MYLKSRQSTENEQTSTPLPAMALKIPPKNPTKSRTTACQVPKLVISSTVFLLCSLEFCVNKFYCYCTYLFKRKRAKAKLKKMDTNPSFFCSIDKRSSTTSKPFKNIHRTSDLRRNKIPKIIPAIAPQLQNRREWFSNFIFIQNMVKAAEVIPKDK